MRIRKTIKCIYTNDTYAVKRVRGGEREKGRKRKKIKENFSKVEKSYTKKKTVRDEQQRDLEREGWNCGVGC